MALIEVSPSPELFRLETINKKLEHLRRWRPSPEDRRLAEAGQRLALRVALEEWDDA